VTVTITPEPFEWTENELDRMGCDMPDGWCVCYWCNRCGPESHVHGQYVEGFYLPLPRCERCLTEECRSDPRRRHLVIDRPADNE
jgi:hypothetical protein